MNLCIGGAAGDGIETMAGILEKILQRSGFYLFSMRDFMSRIRGGHNFAQIRFSPDPVGAHADSLDILIAYDMRTYTEHQRRLKPDGLLLCDPELGISDSRMLPIPLKSLAKESGNARTIGVICIGALMKLLGLPLTTAESVLREMLSPKLLDVNLVAVRKGFDSTVQKQQLPSPKADGRLLVTGAETMALGALAGGLQFYSAYPMSPSTTLLTFFATHAEKCSLVVEQAEDEIAAINMALGASYAGAQAMVGTSGGGFSLMVEGLGFAGIAELPVVIADIQRPGPATGLPTRTEQSDLLFTCFASQGEFPRMVIAVRDAADAFYQTARALQLAKKYQIPVLVLSDQYLADSAVTIAPLDILKAAQSVSPLPPQADATGVYQRYALTESGVSPMRIPGKSDALVRIDSDEHGEGGTITEDAQVRIQMVDKRARKLEGLTNELLEPAYTGAAEPQMLLVGFGSTSAAIAEAVTLLNNRGCSIGALAFGDLYPLPQKQLTRYWKHAKAVYSVEQNATAQLAKLIRMEANLNCTDSLLKYNGRQMSVDDILTGLEAFGIGKEVPV
ncbi:MAG: 2-oxoacid:acceptor oxidoreductase subunit alpha [Eubacteriales bacterium]|nr:2-oxoacid:acceptor oxidoreductase subunit alpha [Eubacteriales bacterium]